MNPPSRASLIFGVLLIAAGAVMLLLTLLPGASLALTWPVIFYIFAAGFALPYFAWPAARRGLAALFIPGAILLSLGLVFTYNVLTSDWVSWAYAWLLIVTGVGAGLALAGSLGGWSRPVFWVGVWMAGVSVGLFGLFATLFGAPLLKTIGALLVMAAGALLLLRSFRR